MDIDDLRSLIRASLDERIKEMKGARRKIPKTFSEFNQLVKEAIEDSGSSEEIQFEESYRVWENLSREAESVEEWNDSLKYYVSSMRFSKCATQGIFNKLRR